MRLTHLGSRLKRISIENLDSESKSIFKRLEDGIGGALKGILDNTPSEDPVVLLEVNQSDQSKSDSSDDDERKIPMLARTSTRNLFALPARLSNLQKWNLQLIGDVKSLPVHNFLERIEEMRQARNVSE
ncbi:hypothetical protein HHI36_013295 [Cryptolaemus montrouzieri]|uniref:Uncharacterized protein n=1 Tax=Cryptolaemus montrouzieri TaxID=559131 RepID=A0ABD2NHH6_9CUCU